MERRTFLKNMGFLAVGLGVLMPTDLGAENTLKERMAATPSSAGGGTFVLWQLPSQTGGQMNSYVMRTANGGVLVIDGGFAADADYLRGFLAALGNQVDMWFISHQHIDHINALTAVLENPRDLKIHKIYGSMLEEQWIKSNEPTALEGAVALNVALRNVGKEVIELQLGQVIELGGLSIKIIGVKNPEIISNGGNNSSVVIKVWDSEKSVLFTGDLGVEGGRKLLNGEFRNELKSDYVQMAHHGQHGVEEEFYKAVSPKYCLWPTPLWLWDNDNGGGKNSGLWVTLEVRGWMDKLNVEKHYRLFEGLVRVE